MIKKYGDYIAAVVLLVFSAIYYAASLTVAIKDDYGGGALVPKMCAVLIAVCACVLIYNAWKANKKESETPAETPSDSAEMPLNYRLVALTLAAFTLYAIAFDILGFIMSTAAYLVAQIMILAPDKNKKTLVTAVITAVITTASVYLLFQNVFYVMLPTGSLWIGI